MDNNILTLMIKPVVQFPDSVGDWALPLSTLALNSLLTDVASVPFGQVEELIGLGHPELCYSWNVYDLQYKLKLPDLEPSSTSLSIPSKIMLPRSTLSFAILFVFWKNSSCE